MSELPTVEVFAKSELEQVRDSSVPALARSLAERIAELPSMRVDQEGRLKWRGTDEFRVEFAGVPLDSKELQALPAGLSAELSTDPQADSRTEASGLTGWVKIDPKAANLPLQVGWGLSSQLSQWAGVQSSLRGGPLHFWAEYQEQARNEQRKEIWDFADSSRRHTWKEKELRHFGLAGLGLGLGPLQWNVQSWASAVQRTMSYTRTSPLALAEDLHPQGDLNQGSVKSELRLGLGAWSVELDGLVFRSENQEEWSGDSWNESRRYAKGVAQLAYETSLGKWILGGEHNWEGRDFAPQGLWEEEQNAFFAQSSLKWKRMRGELGLRAEQSLRQIADQSYHHTEMQYLPSAGIYYDLPWLKMEFYGRYSARVEFPDASLLVPGSRKISPFEGRVGNDKLLPELIHGTEFGLGIPVPQYRARLEVKAFSALADQMLLRTWTWVGDTAWLSIQNGLSENRRGGEITWTQDFSRGTLSLNAGSWIEDMEVAGPKQELIGGTAKLSYAHRFSQKWSGLGALAFTGPSFESEGEAKPYFEPSLGLQWKPLELLELRLGANSLFGSDRSVEQSQPSGKLWTRTRTQVPQVDFSMNWSLR